MLLVTGPVSQAHGDRAQAHLRRDARAQARRRRRRLRLHRRHLRRELREPGPRRQRHPGRRRDSRLSADADGAAAGHPRGDHEMRAAGTGRRRGAVAADPDHAATVVLAMAAIRQTAQSFARLASPDLRIGVIPAANAVESPEAVALAEAPGLAKARHIRLAALSGPCRPPPPTAQLLTVRSSTFTWTPVRSSALLTACAYNLRHSASRWTVCLPGGVCDTKDPVQ